MHYILLLLMLLPLPGCGVLILGGAAAGTVGYVSGDLSATLDGTFEEVIRATDQAIADNSITQTSRNAGRYSGVYQLRTSQGDKVALNIAYATKDLTNITIRVGVFGDEPLSYQILNEIQSRLK